MLSGICWPGLLALLKCLELGRSSSSRLRESGHNGCWEKLDLSIVLHLCSDSESLDLLSGNLRNTLFLRSLALMFCKQVRM